MTKILIGLSHALSHLSTYQSQTHLHCWNCIELTHYHSISTHTPFSSCKYSSFTNQTSQPHLIACIISLLVHQTHVKHHRNTTTITYYRSSVFDSLALDLRRRWTYIYILIQSMDLLSKANGELVLPDLVGITGAACVWWTARMTKVHNKKQYTVNDFMMSVMNDVENGEMRAEWCRLIQLHQYLYTQQPTNSLSFRLLHLPEERERRRRGYDIIC